MKAAFKTIVEGKSDEAVIKAICRFVDIEPASKIVITSGKNELNRNLREYNKMARNYQYLILRDLDHDAPCASELKMRLLPKRERNLRIVVAVREIESWLLADRTSLSHFLSISQERIPRNPESLDDPKQCLIALAAVSNKKEIREMVPRYGSGAKQGMAYAAYIIDFATNYWRPDIAANEAPSLAYCIKMLKSLSSTK